LTKEEQEFVEFVSSNLNFEDYDQKRNVVSDLLAKFKEKKWGESSFPNLKQTANIFHQILSDLDKEFSWWDSWVEKEWGIVNIYTYDTNWRIEPCYPFVDYKGRCETIRRVPFGGENVYTINEINKAFSEKEVIKKIKENIKLTHDLLLKRGVYEEKSENGESES